MLFWEQNSKFLKLVYVVRSLKCIHNIKCSYPIITNFMRILFKVDVPFCFRSKTLQVFIPLSFVFSLETQNRKIKWKFILNILYLHVCMFTGMWRQLQGNENEMGNNMRGVVVSLNKVRVNYTSYKRNKNWRKNEWVIAFDDSIHKQSNVIKLFIHTTSGHVEIFSFMYFPITKISVKIYFHFFFIYWL
jgi:hypothetical protein